MAFVPISQTARCEFRYTHGSNKLENTFWYRYVGAPPSPSALLNLASAVGNGVAERIRLAMSNGVVLREVYCRDMSVQNANQATALFANGTVGGRVGGPLAGNEAANIVRRTGLTGRTHHGAIRVSEFAEGDVDGNTLTSSLMTLLGNVALQMLVNYVGGQFTAALGSKVLGTSTPLQNALLLDNNVDSQKTRLNAHGT